MQETPIQETRIVPDTPIANFLPIFVEIGAKVAFLVITKTGRDKYIMDATIAVRNFLKETGLHDYEKQGKGEDNKVYIPAYYVDAEKLYKATCSLYRPETKNGDPRIWFSGIKSKTKSNNLLALLAADNEIYVINLSNTAIAESLRKKGFVYQTALKSVQKKVDVAQELKEKIQALHDRGYIEAITQGDTAVGDTLEHELGIQRNNKKGPDYKGIELKAKRCLRKQSGLLTLFDKVPDEGKSYSELVKEFGRQTHDNKKNEERFAVINTISTSKPNSYGFILEVEEDKDLLHLCHVDKNSQKRYLSYWYGVNLRKALAEKHHETFIVEASVKKGSDGKESFQYNRIEHTKDPNVSLFLPLVQAGIIFADMRGYFIIDKKWKWRDHGFGHRIAYKKKNMLFGTPIVYDLRKTEKK